MVNSSFLEVWSAGLLSREYNVAAIGEKESGATLVPPVTADEELSGARFGNITIFPDDPAPPVSPYDTHTLPKPIRKRGDGAKAWRPNPSFPMDDYEGMVESAAHHGMSVGSFIVALCQAYIYNSPFILKQHLRPSMPPMTADQQREFSGMANMNPNPMKLGKMSSPYSSPQG